MKKTSLLCLVFCCCLQLTHAQPAQTFKTNGNSKEVGENEFQLTPAEEDKVGSVWYTKKIDLRNDFTINSQLFFGYDNGSDGIAFVLQPLDIKQIGNTDFGGMGLGYYTITPSLAVEFDTYGNYEKNDPDQDHLAFMKDGDIIHNSVNNPENPYLLNIKYGEWDNAKFSWKASTHTLTVNFLSKSYTYTADIVKSIFKDSPYVYWGFTGATGAGVNDQRVRIDKISIGIAPTVSLTNPTDKATYLAPAAHIKLSATAADKDGTVNKVEFYNGTALLHTETVAPYGFVWRNVPRGNYTITAKAYDNSGLVTTSAPVHISVVPNKPPTVSIINPANNQSYPAPATIHLEAAAKDPDGRITKVEFYNASTLLQTELKPPYTFAWRNVPVGNYTITAKATDNWGAVTTSAVVRVSVHPNIAPTVSITNPANAESFAAPATIDLAASAKDADGRITKVEFYNGATLLTTERKLPYSYHWQNVPAGTYTITAVATDNYGSETTSAAVKVTVTNAMIVSRRPYTKNDKTALNDALQLRVFPNPATTGIANIAIKGLQRDKQATLSIFSATGVAVKTIQLNISSKTIQLNVSSLSKGVYMVRIHSGNTVLTKPFIKL